MIEYLMEEPLLASTAVVVCHQVCTHLRISQSFRFLGVWQLESSAPSLQIFCRSEVRKLAWPFHDLNVLLFKRLLCCLGNMFWLIIMLKEASLTHPQCTGWRRRYSSILSAWHRQLAPQCTVVVLYP